MSKPEQINLEKINSWKQSDVDIVKTGYLVDTREDIIELWRQGYITRIADTNDYYYAYEDYILSGCEIEISYEKFMEELNKGYGNSGIIEISRLMVLSNGIYYDMAFSQ